MKIRLISLLLGLGLASGLSAQTWNILLSGSQVLSLGEITGSAAYASIELDGSTLTWQVHHEGTSGLSMAHFHGPANSEQTAGVAQGIDAGPSPVRGSAELTTGQISQLTSGQWYLNLHTAENPPGELRGQVVDQLGFLPNNLISGAQQVPVVLTEAAGAARIAYDPASRELSWEIAWEGLTGPPTMMHFHGPAAVGANAGVQVNIGAISGLESPSVGSTTITAEQEADLLAGQWYINIHTEANGPGEIRGQVLEIEMPDWYGYSIMSGWANTEGFLGWLEVSEDPWVYSLTLDRYLYVPAPADNTFGDGGWVYVPR